MYVLSCLEEHDLWALLTMLMLMTVRSCRSCLTLILVRGKAGWRRRYRSALYYYKINALIQIPVFSMWWPMRSLKSPGIYRYCARIIYAMFLHENRRVPLTGTGSIPLQELLTLKYLCSGCTYWLC
jgi:hypothetical protein